MPEPFENIIAFRPRPETPLEHCDRLSNEAWAMFEAHGYPRPTTGASAARVVPPAIVIQFPTAAGRPSGDQPGAARPDASPRELGTPHDVRPPSHEETRLFSTELIVKRFLDLEADTNCRNVCCEDDAGFTSVHCDVDEEILELLWRRLEELAAKCGHQADRVAVTVTMGKWRKDDAARLNAKALG